LVAAIGHFASAATSPDVMGGKSGTDLKQFLYTNELAGKSAVFWRGEKIPDPWAVTGASSLITRLSSQNP
jgi:hypothetical protein